MGLFDRKKNQIKLNPTLLRTFKKQQLKVENLGNYAISPDGLMIAWAESITRIIDPSGVIFVNNLKSGEIRELTLPKKDGKHYKSPKAYPYKQCYSIYFSNDGIYFVSILRNSVAHYIECAVWETSTWELLHRIPLDDDIETTRLVISPQKDWLAIAGYPDIYLLGLKTAEVILLEGHGPSLVPSPLVNSVKFIAFHPDGKTLYSAADDGKVICWDLSGNSEDIHGEMIGEHEYAVTCGSLSPDGGMLATSNLFDFEGKSGSIVIWDVNKTCIANKLKKGASNLSFISNTDLISHDTRCNKDDTPIAEVITLLDSKTGKRRDRKEIERSFSNATLSTTGRFLIGEDWDDSLHIWGLF